MTLDCPGNWRGRSEWRREHRGLGRYPEHHLWEAVQGYLDMRAAVETDPPGPD